MHAEGINALGQVVGWAFDGAQQFAWVWLPSPDYHYATAGLHLLTGADGSTPADDAYAFDINDYGIIAGTVGGNAIAWELSAGQPPVLRSLESEPSEAYAVSNKPAATGYEVTGDASLESVTTGQAELRGVLWNVSSSGTVDPPIVFEGSGLKVTASRAITSDGAVAAGYGQFAPGPGACAQMTGNARVWQLDGVILDDPAQIEAAANGISDDLNVAGWFTEPTDPNECERRAIYWDTPETPGASPYVVLHDVGGVFIDDDATIANAIGGLSTEQVVGRNDRLLEAVVWTRIGPEIDDWSVMVMNENAGVAAGRRQRVQSSLRKRHKRSVSHRRHGLVRHRGSWWPARCECFHCLLEPRQLSRGHEC